MSTQHLRHLLHRLVIASNSDVRPLFKETVGSCQRVISPNVPEVLFDSPSPARLQVHMMQNSELNRLARHLVLKVSHPAVLGAKKGREACLTYGPMLPLSDLINGLFEVFDEMELIEHNAGLRQRFTDSHLVASGLSPQALAQLVHIANIGRPLD